MSGAGTSGAGVFMPADTSMARPNMKGSGDDGCSVAGGDMRSSLAPSLLVLLWLARRRSARTTRTTRGIQ